MYNPLEAFRKNARRLIKAQGLNQTEAASFVGWDQAHLSTYLKKREPRLAKIAEFAGKFGVSVQEILSDPTQSQIKPRIIAPTPLEAHELVRRELELAAKLPPGALARLASLTAHQWDILAPTLEALAPAADDGDAGTRGQVP